MAVLLSNGHSFVTSAQMGRRIKEILNFCGCSAYTILTKEDHKIEIFCRHPKCIAPTRRTI